MTGPAANASQAELDKFNALASRWWDPRGPQKALHALNPARLDYVAARTTLREARVLDVGCGGGLLSEALAARGAQVTAIDLAPDLLQVARLHGLESGVTVDYRLSSVETLAAGQPGAFRRDHLHGNARARAGSGLGGRRLRHAAASWRPPVPVHAEPHARGVRAGDRRRRYVARMLPRGTHQYRDFIRPSELAAWLRAACLELEDVSGLAYEPWRDGARLSTRTDVNYLACAVKPDAA